MMVGVVGMMVLLMLLVVSSIGTITIVPSFNPSQLNIEKKRTVITLLGKIHTRMDNTCCLALNWVKVQMEMLALSMVLIT